MARQHPEAWPASTYGHLRDVNLKIVPANKVLFAGIVPANNVLFSGTVPANKVLYAGTVLI